jgi:hypothetical protein
MFSAAGKARDCTTHAANSRKFLMTVRTAIDESSGTSSRRKREIVTALLVGDSQIDAGLLPFSAVRWNAPPASAKLRENVRQFVSQSPIDFGQIFR